MIDRTVHDASSVNADDIGHHVVLRWFEHDPGNVSDFDAHAIVLTIHEALELARVLVQSADEAREKLTDDMICGDCPTCRNVRMVKVEKPNGSTMSEHCPDCQATRAAAAERGIPELIPAEYRPFVKKGRR